MKESTHKDKRDERESLVCCKSIKLKTDETCHIHLARKHLDPSCPRSCTGSIQSVYTKEHPLRWRERDTGRAVESGIAQLEL